MSASAAFAASAAANSAAASAAAHRAKVERCSIEISQFNSKGATIAEMQSYAGCVNTVYPQQMSAEGIAVTKVFIVLALIGAVVGIAKANNDSLADGVIDYFMFSLMGALFVPAFCAFVGGAFYGAAWVLGVLP